jgi:hypothetical protein
MELSSWCHGLGPNGHWGDNAAHSRAVPFQAWLALMHAHVWPMQMCSGMGSLQHTTCAQRRQSAIGNQSGKFFINTYHLLTLIGPILAQNLLVERICA